jgi:ribonuclease BN (tRNA processing enzyme)
MAQPTLLMEGLHRGCWLIAEPVLHRLLEAGCPGSQFDALLLTHLHSDHIVDLFQLLISSKHQVPNVPNEYLDHPGQKSLSMA